MTKKALCVGVNDYPFGEENDLRGCVNDANQWAALLKDHFDFTDVKRLIDAEATKANILSNLKTLVKGAKAGDVVVFTNASHGTYIADKDGDEYKYDEAICPHDTDSNLLVDDELRNIFKNLAKGVQFVVISDSCHSGSVTRVKAEGGRRNRQLNPRLLGNLELDTKQLRDARNNTAEKYPESGMKELLLSGCMSNQTSADAEIDNDFHGAMSYYAIKTIEDAGYKLTYSELHRRLVPTLRDENYSQEPQLEGNQQNKDRQIFT